MLSTYNLNLNLNNSTLDKVRQIIIGPPSSPSTRRTSRVRNWDRLSHRAAHDEVAGPQVLAVPLGMSEDGEGGVAGGVDAPQLLQGLAVLVQPLQRSLQAVWEGQRGQRGGQGQFGLWEKRRKGTSHHYEYFHN